MKMYWPASPPRLAPHPKSWRPTRPFTGDAADPWEGGAGGELPEMSWKVREQGVQRLKKPTVWLGPNKAPHCMQPPRGDTDCVQVLGEFGRARMGW